MPGRHACCFLIPGDWHTLTGGFTYDRRMVLGLREAGWDVDVQCLEGTWPWPDAAALAAAQARIEALADGTLVVADGLAFGAMPDVLQPHARRLRWVALVHHPLHLEAGLGEASRQRLLASETRALQTAARQVVVTSHRTAMDVNALGVPANRIAVVEPGTDRVVPGPAVAGAERGTQRGTGARHEGEGRAPPVCLLCVATLTPRKGHAILLEALAGLPMPAAQAWELHNVGSLTRDPETAARVQALSRSLALADRVVWHGEVGAAQLHTHYRSADLFVQPSLHEGYGMAVAQALAHGLPVLASSAGALADTLAPDAGVHVPPGDVPALRAALARLITDPGLRTQLAAGARSAAQRLPDWPLQAARFASVLDGVT